MWMPEEFAREVDAYKQGKVDETEKDILRERKPSDDEEKGQYTEGLEQKVWEEDRVYQGGS
jgi:hypothetical protein